MSVTLRPIGPAVSCSWAIGIIPSCETRPRVGFKPTMFSTADGPVIEPSVSVPTATAHRFAATPLAEPELDPHDVQPRSYALIVFPPRALQPTASGYAMSVPRKLAHSPRFALP